MKRFAIVVFLAVLSLQLRAQSMTEAEELIAHGEYSRAIPILEGIAVKEPKNSKVNILLGDCFRLSGRDADAVAQYNKAKARGNNDAYLGLLDVAVREYRVEDADALLAAYRKGLKKGRKTLPDESGEIVGRLDRTRNMLNRVERIQVFDSVNVPAADFFRHYRLSSESGSLNSPSVLPAAFSAADPTVVYEPESRSEMIWAAPDDQGRSRLVRSVALYGNEWDYPHPVGNHLGEGGDANYPFLMPDGVTLYFASDGDNSLGGYDIFITRSDGRDFLQPQNLGMPYNSPYNDYMLAIDETTGVGWWASDRNQIPDSVTIYMFVPSEVRRNVDISDPDLTARARLTSIAITRDGSSNYAALRSAIDNIRSSASSLDAQCHFLMPDGRVITRIEQLSNADAREALRQYIDLKAGIDADAVELARLRRAYAAGDTDARIDILALERRCRGDREALKKASNEVIICELGQHAK